MTQDYSLKNRFNKTVSTALVAAQLGYLAAPSISYSADINANRPTKGIPSAPIKESERNADYGKSGSWMPLGLYRGDTTYVLVRNAEVKFDKHGKPLSIVAPITTHLDVNNRGYQVYLMDIHERWLGGIGGGKRIQNYIVRNGKATFVQNKEGKFERVYAPRINELNNKTNKDSLETRVNILESTVSSLTDSSDVDRIISRVVRRELTKYKRSSEKPTTGYQKPVIRDTTQTTPREVREIYKAKQTQVDTTRKYVPVQKRTETVTKKDSLESKATQDSLLAGVNKRIAKDFEKKESHLGRNLLIGALLVGAGYLIYDKCKDKDGEDETGLTGGQTGGPGIR